MEQVNTKLKLFQARSSLKFGADDGTRTRNPHCKLLYWYQEFLCPVEPLYFSDEKSTTVEEG